MRLMEKFAPPYDVNVIERIERRCMNLEIMSARICSFNRSSKSHESWAQITLRSINKAQVLSNKEYVFLVFERNLAQKLSLKDWKLTYVFTDVDQLF